MNKEALSADYWKILKGECTLPEAMKIFGASQEVVDISMNEIGQDTGSYFKSSMLNTLFAYAKLVTLKEIDATRLWNFAAKDYDTRSNARHGDLGCRNGEVMRFTGDKWELMYKL